MYKDVMIRDVKFDFFHYLKFVLKYSYTIRNSICVWQYIVTCTCRRRILVTVNFALRFHLTPHTTACQTKIL